MAAEYMTVAQYAERYGLSDQAVRRMCARRAISATKVGGVWRIADDPPGGRASDVDAELAAMRREVSALREWKESLCRALSGETAR